MPVSDQSGLRADIDPLLNSILVKVANEQSSYIVNDVAPYITTSSRAGTYLKYTKASFLGNSDESFERAANDTSEEIDVATSTGTFTGTEYSAQLSIDISDEQEASNGALDLKRDGMEALWHRLQIEKEKKLHTLMTTTGNWTATEALAAGQEWDDTTGDLLKNLDASIRAFFTQAGHGPDCMVISLQDLHSLRQHPDITAKVVSNNNSNATVNFEQLEQILAEEFGLKKLFVSKAVKNNADSGATYSGSFVWTADTAFLGFCGVGGDVNGMSNVAAKTFGPRDWTPKSYFDDSRKSTVLELSSIYVLEAISADMGYTITNTQA